MSCELVSDKVSKAKAAGEASCAFRISLYIDVIILDSAWRTATSRPLASQSQANVAGA